MTNEEKNAFEEFINRMDLSDFEDSRDEDEKLIDALLEGWFEIFYPDKEIEPDKRDFLVKVFKETKKTGIHKEWYPYAIALLEWLKVNAEDERSKMLAPFILGYCWREASDE